MTKHIGKMSVDEMLAECERLEPTFKLSVDGRSVTATMKRDGVPYELTLLCGPRKIGWAKMTVLQSALNQLRGG